MEKIFTFVTGDWSDDGHGKTNTSFLKFVGSDLSSNRLQESFGKSVTELGVDPYKLFENELNLTGIVQDRLEEAGFFKWMAEFNGEEDYDEGDFLDDENSLECLFAWMVTRNLPDVSFSVIEFDNLAGDGDRILTSPGNVESKSSYLLYDNYIF